MNAFHTSSHLILIPTVLLGGQWPPLLKRKQKPNKVKHLATAGVKMRSLFIPLCHPQRMKHEPPSSPLSLWLSLHTPRKRGARVPPRVHYPVSSLTSSLSLLGKGICPTAPVRGILGHLRSAELAQGMPEAWGPGKLLGFH